MQKVPAHEGKNAAFVGSAFWGPIISWITFISLCLIMLINLLWRHAQPDLLDRCPLLAHPLCSSRQVITSEIDEGIDPDFKVVPGVGNVSGAGGRWQECLLRGCRPWFGCPAVGLGLLRCGRSCAAGVHTHDLIARLPAPASLQFGDR